MEHEVLLTADGMRLSRDRAKPKILYLEESVWRHTGTIDLTMVNVTVPAKLLELAIKWCDEPVEDEF